MDLSTVTSTKDSKTRNSIRKDKTNDHNDYIRSIHSTSNQKNEYITKKKYFDSNNPTSATIELTHNLYNQNDDNDDDDDNSSNDSMETVSDEIPIWVHGEQRWISGVNDNTTCSDLVNVLLADEGITSASTTINNTVNKGFVITEKWRRVEQILNDDTKILKIWSAWGHAKSEVKLTLRQINTNLSVDWTADDDITTADNTLLSCILNNNDKDSGMGSPNGSSNSAIIRRKKHRATKTSATWVAQHAETLHPKSQKATIEKLMKLILEQGETIQQQLAKLRDRELEITKIEEERHKTREKEHGKNYLLETYLNGLHEIDEKEIVIGTSGDSGVQTEGALSSNEICQINENENYSNQSNQNTKTNEIQSFQKYNTLPVKEKKSHREKKLLKEHKNAKEFSTLLQQQDIDQEKYTKKTFSSTNAQIKCSTPKKLPTAKDTKTTSDLNDERKLPVDNVDDEHDNELNVTEKIEWLEKLIVINKHLQREEELLVRLGAKLRKLESDDPLLDEKQILEQISQLNDSLVHGNDEIRKIENEIVISKEILTEKQIILNKLNDELLNSTEELGRFGVESENHELPKARSDSSVSVEDYKAPSASKTTEIDDKFSILPSIITLNENPSDLNKNIFNNDKIVENLYSYSQYISKPNYEYNIRNENIMNDMNLMAQPPTISNESNNEYKFEHLVAAQAEDLSNPSNFLPMDKNISLLANQQNYQFDAAVSHPLTNPSNGYSSDQNYSTVNQEQIPNVTSEMFKLNHPLAAFNQSALMQQHQQQFIVNQRQQNLILKAPVLNCKNHNPIVSKINTNKSIGTKCNQNTIQNQSINFINNQKFEQQKKIKFHFENDDTNLLSNENTLSSFKQTKHDLNLMNIYGLEQFNNLPKQNQKLNGKKLTSILKTTSNTNDGKLHEKKLISNCNSNDIESNSDTGLSSMSEDITNIGTLV